MEVVNGSFVVSWELPPELGESGEGVRVEVNVSGEWVEVGSDLHTFRPTTESYTLHLRVSVCVGVV